MIRKIIALGLVLMIMLTMFTGCSNDSEEAHTGKYEVLGEAVLSGKWQMYQFRLELEPGSQFDIDLLDLVIGDKVDGYFYPETEVPANMEITAGENIIFKIEPADATAGGIVSDRFSFVVNQPFGTAYVLKFSNSDAEKNVSVFVEVIYPATGKIRGPLNVK